jgi:hypothetical protein
MNEENGYYRYCSLSRLETGGESVSHHGVIQDPLKGIFTSSNDKGDPLKAAVERERARNNPATNSLFLFGHTLILARNNSS